MFIATQPSITALHHILNNKRKVYQSKWHIWYQNRRGTKIMWSWAKRIKDWSNTSSMAKKMNPKTEDKTVQVSPKCDCRPFLSSGYKTDWTAPHPIKHKTEISPIKTTCDNKAYFNHIPTYKQNIYTWMQNQTFNEHINNYQMSMSFAYRTSLSESK